MRSIRRRDEARRASPSRAPARSRTRSPRRASTRPAAWSCGRLGNTRGNIGSQHFVHTGLVNRFLVAALTVLTACDGSAPTQGQTLAAIQSRKQITWGADVQGGEPYVYEDPKDPSKRVGFEVDLMDAIGRRLGVTPVFVQAQWSNLVPGLERGDFDVIVNGLEATAERKERLLLS